MDWAQDKHQSKDQIRYQMNNKLAAAEQPGATHGAAHPATPSKPAVHATSLDAAHVQHDVAFRQKRPDKRKPENASPPAPSASISSISPSSAPGAAAILPSSSLRSSGRCTCVRFDYGNHSEVRCCCRLS